MQHYNQDTPESMLDDEPCTPSTLPASANYVNLQLTAHNYPVPLKFVNADENDACKVVNCLLRLLTDKQTEAQERQDMASTIKQLKQELASTKSTLTTQTKKLAEAHRQIDQEAAKRAAVAKSVQAEEKRHKATKEELQKTKINLHATKAQYAHEIRKRELENGKIRDRLQKLLDEGVSKNGMVAKMSSPVDKAGALFGVPKPDRAAKEEQLHKSLLEKSIERENYILNDNKLLRKTIEELHSALKGMLQGQIQQYHDDAMDTDAPELSQFRIPMELGGSHMKQAMLDLISRLRIEWDEQIARRKVYTAEEVKEKDMAIERLTVDLEEVFTTLEQVQEDFDAKTEAYLKFSQGSFFDTIAHNHEMDISSDDIIAPEIEDEANALRKLHKQVRDERQKLTEAAIKLGEERTQLMHERRAFEQNKHTHDTQVVLDELSENDEEPSDTIKTLQNLELQGSSKKRKMDKTLQT